MIPTAVNHINDTVKVVGIVDHICEHEGKKILLVAPNGLTSIHVESDERFDDTLTGTEITVVGIVKELIVDEQYCQELESDEHAEDHSEEKYSEEMIKQRKKQAQIFRDSMKRAGVDHLSIYSLKLVTIE